MKGRRTPRQREALARQREHGKGLRSWLEDRLKEARKRDHTPRETPPGGNGVTRLMRNITKPEPQYLIQHDFAPGLGGRNEVYRKPLEELRDNRKGSRRLRPELRARG